MGPRLFDHKEMAVRIMEDGDVDGAISHVLAMLAGRDSKTKYSAFRNIRAHILRQEHYRSEEGYQQLREMAMRDGLNPTDRTLLQTLLFKPLHFMRWAQVSKRYLSDWDLQQELMAIKIVKDPFYEFDCPEKIKRASHTDEKMQVEQNHKHKRKPREHYIFTSTEIDDMVRTATDYISSEMDWSKRCNSIRLLECLCLLTGRRKWELCSTMKIKTVPEFDYQADICGICKVIAHKTGDVWHRIPLLAPVHLIIKGITNLRLMGHVMGQYNGYAKMFPKMTHTHYRNVFADRAYMEREKNGFHEDETMSQLQWKRLALVLDMQTYCDHYSTMLTDANEREQQDKPGSLSGSACGSPEYDVYDPVRCGGQHPDQQEGHHAECVSP